MWFRRFLHPELTVFVYKCQQFYKLQSKLISFIFHFCTIVNKQNESSTLPVYHLKLDNSTLNGENNLLDKIDKQVMDNPLHSTPKPIPPYGLFHGIMMTVAWIALEQVAIWALMFRDRTRWAIYIHAAAMTLTAMMTLITATEIICYEGIQIIWKNWYHDLSGFVATCLLPFVLLLGFIAKVQQNSPRIHPNSLDKLKMSHTISGWVMISATRVFIYVKWVTKVPILFILLVFFDLIAHIAYVTYKVYRPRMQNKQINAEAEQYQVRDSIWIRQIKKLSDLEIYHGDYFIFADYVYRLSPILNAHPGGYRIIEQIRTRQVDRFIYGVEPLQKFEDVPRVSHTANSIKLAGLPIARLEKSHIYSKMKIINPARVSGINFYQSSKRIYTVYLCPKNPRHRTFAYTGYTNLSQLGKYFTVTIGGSKTRMYTMVNFLHRRTIKLIEIITKGQVFSPKEEQNLRQNGFEQKQENYFKTIIQWEKSIQNEKIAEEEISWRQGKQQEKKMLGDEQSTSDKFSISTQNEIQLEEEEENRSNSSGKNHRRCIIPLLIKKYQNGQFTSAFLHQNFKGDIMISPPRGRGLALQDILDLPKPYNLVLFSGGTGIYPFADLIDLLFKDLLLEKQLLAEEQKKFKNLIKRNNPILQKNPFKHFNVSLYISVPMLQEIHPITLFQCEFLALHKKVNVYLKSHCQEDRGILKQRYPHIQSNDQRYEKLIWQMKQNETSRIYICGPTRMNKAVLVQLERLCWNPSKYVVL